MQPTLESRLSALVATLDAPREDGGAEATLTALMPCEPAVGEVAVACWTDSAGGELVELVRLDDGSRIADPVALREALTLLAMVETVEELASFDDVHAFAEALRAWQPASHHDDHTDADSPAGADARSFSRARESALSALDAIAALAPPEVRIARPQRLDELGAALRELERAWTVLEQRSEAWCDAALAASDDDPAVIASVRELWEALGAVRRGPLARSVATALHDGREAGTSMAAAIAAN